MIIPFVNLNAQYLSIKEEVDNAIGSVIRDSAFISGKYVKSFEEHFASYVNAKHCIGVGNGTDALFIALKTIGVKSGDEVIVPANTFIATSEAVAMCGARVVFVDCDPETYTIDVHQLRSIITSKTRAIIPVHLYGQPADMDPILDMARKNNICIIEDAAQAHGSKYKGRSIGSMGVFACFSFFPGKNLGAYGDAGALVTNDDELAHKARMFANHGRIEKYNHNIEGINSRLDGLQAAILDVKLRHLDDWTKRRIKVAMKYNDALNAVVVTPKVRPDVRHVYHLYVIRVNNRERIIKHLFDKGISTGIHYPIALPFLKAYRYLSHKSEDFPVAHALQTEILSLPIHGDINDDQLEYVINELKNAVQESGHD